jgi:hypothetical protein
MQALQTFTTIERDGELTLHNLPCKRGDKVEAIVLVLATATEINSNDMHQSNTQSPLPFRPRAFAGRVHITESSLVIQQKLRAEWE